jgi:hypothetical protein
LQRWDWFSHIRFVPAEGAGDQGAPSSYDLVYRWVASEAGRSPVRLAERMKEIGQALRRGGHAFVVGPALLGRQVGAHGLHVCWEEPVEQLPTFRMHRTILPKARLRAGLTLFHMQKV